MTVRRVDNEAFQPVVLEFTLETQEQVDALHCIWNHPVLTGFLADHECGDRTGASVRSQLPASDQRYDLLSEMKARLQKDV